MSTKESNDPNNQINDNVNDEDGVDVDVDDIVETEVFDIQEQIDLLCNRYQSTRNTKDTAYVWYITKKMMITNNTKEGDNNTNSMAWKSKLERKVVPMLVVVMKEDDDDVDHDNEDNNDPRTKMMSLKEHEIWIQDLNRILQFCWDKNIKHYLLQRSSNKEIQDHDTSTNRNTNSNDTTTTTTTTTMVGEKRKKNNTTTNKNSNKVYAICFIKVQENDRSTMESILQQPQIMYQSTVPVLQISIAEVIENVLYNLFYINKMKGLWYITMNGHPKDWSNQLFTGSMLTIVLGTTSTTSSSSSSSYNNNNFIDTILTECRKLNKDHYIINPTILGFDRIKALIELLVVVQPTSSSTHHPSLQHDPIHDLDPSTVVAICLPRIRYQDIQLMRELRLKSRQILYTALGTGWTKNVQVAINEYIQTYQKNDFIMSYYTYCCMKSSTRNSSSSSSSSSSSNDDENELDIDNPIKIMDMIDDDNQISLVLLECTNPGTLHESDDAYKIAELCYNKNTPYVWIDHTSCTEIISSLGVPTTIDDMPAGASNNDNNNNNKPTTKSHCVCLLKLKPVHNDDENDIDDDDDGKNNIQKVIQSMKADLQNILEIVAHEKLVSENKRKGRDTMIWSESTTIESHLRPQSECRPSPAHTNEDAIQQYAVVENSGFENTNASYDNINDDADSNIMSHTFEQQSTVSISDFDIDNNVFQDVPISNVSVALLTEEDANTYPKPLEMTEPVQFQDYDLTSNSNMEGTSNVSTQCTMNDYTHNNDEEDLGDEYLNHNNKRQRLVYEAINNKNCDEESYDVDNGSVNNVHSLTNELKVQRTKIHDDDINSAVADSVGPVPESPSHIEASGSNVLDTDITSLSRSTSMEIKQQIQNDDEDDDNFDDDDSSSESSEHECGELLIDTAKLRLEEEVALLEMELNAIKARKAAIARELMLERKNGKEIQDQIDMKIETALKLSRRYQKQTDALKRFTNSINKSEKTLQRLLDADVTVEEIAQLSASNVDPDELSTELSIVDSGNQTCVPTRNEEVEPMEFVDTTVDGNTDSLLVASNSTETNTNSLYSGLLKSLPIAIKIHKISDHPAFAQFWQCKGDPKGSEYNFVISFNSKDLLKRALALCSREILIMDDDDSSGRHRRESMWNACLDVRLLITETCITIVEKEDKIDQSNSKTRLDPTIFLCTYELIGTCSDPYCSYQHVKPRDVGSILPRELVPLPKLTLRRSSKKKSSNIDDIETPKGNGQIVSTANNDMEGSFTNNDDFLFMPPAPADVSVNWNETILQWTIDAGMGRFWWMTDSDTASLSTSSNTVTIIALMQLVFGCVHLASEETFVSESYSIQTIGDAFTFAGTLVDLFRLAIHSGRFDLTQGLLEMFTNVRGRWDSQLETVKALVSTFGQVQDTLSRVETMSLAFGSITGKNSFVVAFESQLVLALVSHMIATLHENQSLVDSTQVSEITKLLRSFEVIFDSPSQDDTTVDDIDKLLDRIFSSDKAKTVNDGEKRDMLGEMLFLLEDIAVGRILHKALKYVASSRLLIDDVLVRIQKETTKLIRDASVNKVSTRPVVKSTIWLSYSVLGVLENAAQLVLRDEDVDKRKMELEEVYMVLDNLLLTHRSLLSSVSALDLILAPIFGANVALACTIRFYDKAQNRLESLLTDRNVNRTGKSISFAPISELLWSQLLQLHMSLPERQCSVEATERLKSSLDIPPKLDKVHDLLTDIVVSERQVFPHHITLPNDWNIVNALVTCSNEMDQVETTPSKLFDCSWQMHQRLLNENDIKFQFDFSRNQLAPRNSRGFNSQLPSSIPYSLILSASFLLELNIQASGICKLPHHFGIYFSSLHHLDLSENNIQELPETMYLMVELVTINVSWNKLTALPANFAPPKLTTLLATNNKIKALPFLFINCKNLEILNLNENPVDSRFWVLAGNFTKLRELQPNHVSTKKISSSKQTTVSRN